MFPIQKMLLPDHYGREGQIPIAIVNHVSVGNKQSVINTFRNTANKVSSTFLNCRDGSIVQFCEITQKPKTNGNIRNARSPLVKQMGGINPNLYSVTIENEDAFNDDTPGVDGQLTEAQFISLCWLHKYIQTEVKRTYGNKISLNSHQVIGHRDVDSIGKSFCPGNNFPFDRLYRELAIADTMTLEAYEEDLLYRTSDAGKSTEVFAFFERFNVLGSRMTHPKYGAESRRKIMLMAPYMPDLGVEGDVTPEMVLSRLKDLRSEAIVNGKWIADGLQKASFGAKYAKQAGILV